MCADSVTQKIEILLVEDSRGDVRLIREALKSAEVSHNLHVVTDGEAAMSFLRRDAPYEGMPRPDIIILDLNIPKKNGRSVLNDIKTSSDLRRIPVIVLTTSSREDDIVNCYDLYANCYITKPIEMKFFVNIVKRIDKYWFATVKLPPH